MKRILQFAASLSVLVLSVPFLRGQQIRLEIINAKNGKPIKNECVNVWTGTGRDRHLVAETGSDGVAVLRLKQGELVAENSCKDWEPYAPIHPESDALMLLPNWQIACQEYRKVVPGEPFTNPLPSYSVKTILESGISASNTCGHFRVPAKPGELILFVRSPTFWENMRR